MKNTLIILGLIIIIAGSGVVIMLETQAASTNSNNVSPSQTVATVPFKALAEGTQSKITSRVNYLITTQAQLVDLWNFLEKAPPVPTVDFNTQVVVAVFAGQVPTTGYGIAVAAVEDASSRIVEVELTKPDPSCVLAQSTTAPYQVIELPKTSLPFTHDDTWTTKSCN